MAGGRTRAQKNKPHKSRLGAKSQRAQHRMEGGPKAGAGARTAAKDRTHAPGSKAERHNQSKLRREQKRAEVLAQKRRRTGDGAADTSSPPAAAASVAAAAGVLGSVVGPGASSEPPRIVVLVPLHESVPIHQIYSDLAAACDATSDATSASSAVPAKDLQSGQDGDADMDIAEVAAGVLGKDGATAGAVGDKCDSGPGGMSTVRAPRFKSRFAVAVAPHGNVSRLLELCKVAEILVFVVPAKAAAATPANGKAAAASAAAGASELLATSSSSASHIDQWGRLALSLARAQGLPSVVGLVHGVVQVEPVKRRSEAKKAAVAALQSELPKDSSHVFACDTDAEWQQVLRHISERRLQPPVWRTQRPYVVARKVEFTPNQAAESEPGAGRQGQSGPAKGSLAVYGYLRGRALCVNQLAHLTGVGDFQLERIDVLRDPCPARVRKQKGKEAAGGGGAVKEAEMTAREDEEMALEEEANERGAGAAGGAAAAGAGEGGQLSEILLSITAKEDLQEPLVVENVPDSLAGEQTWPTEEEMAQADAEVEERSKGKKSVAGKGTAKRIRVPKGTSEYQAAWYEAVPKSALKDDEEENEEEEDGSEDEDDGGEVEDDGEDDGAQREGGGAGGTREEDWDGRSEMDGSEFPMEEDEEEESLVDEEDSAQSAKAAIEEKKKLREQEREDQEFPDEVDVPPDVAARVRFAKYRGLKSFRTSFWDPKELLPEEYGRIFAFDNVKRTQKAALRRAEAVDRGEVEGSVSAVGAYLRVVVRNVPAADADKLAKQVEQGQHVLLTGLLQHETRMTVLHCALRKWEGVNAFAGPIKSKQPLLVHMGFRSFVARPIYSTDDINLDKHKFERFLHPGRFSVASVYAPAAFPPLPLLAFSLPDNLPSSSNATSLDNLPAGAAALEDAKLAATGSLRGADVDRIILKKIVLSGYPVSVAKRKAVVRYMFHNPDDVRWFKPVELFTKYGRRGRIRESVGTKGGMKCVFDGVVQQRDAVCMSLYKRVYPKWPQHLKPSLQQQEQQ